MRRGGARRFRPGCGKLLTVKDIFRNNAASGPFTSRGGKSKGVFMANNPQQPNQERERERRAQPGRQDERQDMDRPERDTERRGGDRERERRN
jgi:hypothetical protein